MYSYLAAPLLVNLSVGAALLLAWQYDRSQPFTRWIGLAFLVNALTAPGYALYFGIPSLWWLGGLLWAAQQAAFTLLLTLGIAQLQGHNYSARQLYVAGATMFLSLLAAIAVDARIAALFTAVFFSIQVLLLVRKLYQGELAHKLAAVMLVANAVVWWIAPLAGMEAYPLQAYLVAAVRMLLGMTLLIACLRHSALQSRQLTEQLLKLTEGSHQGIAVLQDGRTVYANAALLRMFQLNDLHNALTHWDTWGMSATDRLLNEGRRARLLQRDTEKLTWEQPWTRRDGTAMHLRMTAWLIDWNERPAEQIVISDETGAHESAQRLIHQATHDRLTGLPNRLGMEDIVRQSLLQTGAPPLALILVDVDRFSSINDAFGYVLGDELLKQVAARLTCVLPEGDVLARIAGDEFLILHRNAGDHAATLTLMNELLRVLRQPLHLENTTLNISGSAGASLYPADGAAFATLLSHANLAVKSAKAAGRNTARFFDSSMNAALIDDMQLASDLHEALRDQQFELHFQPIVDMQTGALLGAEALLRWNHPQRGRVSPARFIPIAERTGLIIDIGGWVIDRACATLAAWQASPALARLVLSINVSATQFGRGDVDQVVDAALNRHAPPRHLLELEVTESALINEPEEFVDLLARLRQLGVRLAIDDFGTGYSNLAYLQRFKVDKLKIDQSFVRSLLSTPQDRAIVQAIIQMARSLNLRTTAEGIETHETLAALASLGCDQAQGYWFSPPLPLPDFERWQRAHSQTHALH